MRQNFSNIYQHHRFLIEDLDGKLFDGFKGNKGLAFNVGLDCFCQTVLYFMTWFYCEVTKASSFTILGFRRISI